MSRLFRLRLGDGTSWAVTAPDVAAARTKAENYFPNESAAIEESVNGEPWQLVSAPCTCSPEQREILSSLGDYCEDSCGRRP